MRPSMPNSLAELGMTLEIGCAGRTTEFDTGTVLCTNAPRNTLYIFRPQKSAAAEIPPHSADGKTWKLWSQFYPDSARRVVVPSPKMLFYGIAEYIIYRSDKWDAEENDYIHTFTSKPEIWRGSTRNNCVWVITGGKLSVRSAGITG
jgi:hypothetical protein